MNLEELELKKAEITKLNKRGIMTVEDVQMFLPRTYYDFTEIKPLHPSLDGKFIAVVGTFAKMETKKTNQTLMLKAKVYEKDTEKKLNVMWIGNYYLKNIIKDWEGSEVIVCGKLTYSEDYHSFHMNNPIIFSQDIKKNLSVYPVYTKMSGISEEWMNKTIAKALERKIEDTLPEEIRKHYGLMSMSEAVLSLHYPKSMAQVESAQKRLVFNVLYNFACSIEERENAVSKSSVYNIKSYELLKKYAALLPFELTKSQKTAVNEMCLLERDGRRISALVQGDVGSGKTVVAFSMMFSMAGSGYQSVLMAPTEILAKQHYDELSKYANELGIETAFLSGTLKAKEKKTLYAKIKDGSIKLIVGTHSVVSEGLEYNDLALAVVDEEHRFGVAVEENLFAKSDKGMHVISMSATPIPRTITDVIFSDSTRIYDLERPSGRQEVQTCIFNNDEKIYNFLEKEIREGRQAYVVCPLIEDSDIESRKHVLSVERVEDNYKKRFETSGIRIASVTGKTKKEESEDILNSFKDGEIDILISTTVIEVGVNNPNVSTIVISNAEMFGVAQLHQLRGRVGRGQYKGYCILKSADKENERLNMLCSTTNGFELAEMDAKLRGPGDILGERQSGKNRELELVLMYPEMYKYAQKEAKKSHIAI